MQFTRRNALRLGFAATGAAALSSTALGRSLGWLSVNASPPASTKPWVRWWWPGGAVQIDELRREIALLSAAGFGGAEIQAFNPGILDMTPDERLHVNDYANAAFFDKMETVADAALKNGVEIDYTFGSAWPSGGGLAITPELALLELTPAITTISAPVSGPIQIKLPTQTKKFGAMGSLDKRNRDPRVSDWKARLEKRWKLIAVLAFKGETPQLQAEGKKYRETNVVTPGKIEGTKAIVLTDRVQSDGTLDWTPPSDGEWQIVAFKQFTVDSSAMGAVGEGPQLVLDHFKKAAFAAHAERVGGPLAGLGANKKALRAMFVDSLELMTDLYWSDTFLEEFSKRRGYDLTPYLHHILQPGWEAPWDQRFSPSYYESGKDTDDRIRFDYRVTLSELIDENFWRPFVDWSHANGFEARIQAHGGPSYLVASYGLADIPETEDLGGGGSPHFLRLARAAADIYGKNTVSCESLCWPLKPYEITPADWLARMNFLFAGGVNALIYHGFPYALHKEKWPGWFPFAPSPFLRGFSSQINEGNPFWAAIPTLNGYVQRAQAVLQRGKNHVPVAVLMTNPGADDNEGDKDIEHFLDGMLNAGYDYDRMPYSALDMCSVSNGALVTNGGAAFDVLVVPPLDGISPRAIVQIMAFHKAGLKVVFVDKVPFRSNSLTDARANDECVRAAMSEIGRPPVPASELINALSSLSVEPNLQFKTAPCLFIDKRNGEQRLLVLHNRKEVAVTITAVVRTPGYPVKLDLFTGQSFALTSTRAGQHVEFSTEIQPGGAAFIVFQEGRGKTQPQGSPIKHLPLGEHWDLSAEGHGNKGRTISYTQPGFELRDFVGVEALKDFSGQATYRTQVDISADWLKRGQGISLDLGVVHDMARIRINGKDAGVVLASPFSVHVTPFLRSGKNTIEIVAINSANNAMMDPKLAGMKELTQKPAGLIGPVVLALDRL